MERDKYVASKTNIITAQSVVFVYNTLIDHVIEMVEEIGVSDLYNCLTKWV